MTYDQDSTQFASNTPLLISSLTVQIRSEQLKYEFTYVHILTKQMFILLIETKQDYLL